MTTFDPDTVLSPSSGAPALNFPEIGTVHKGRITAKEARQQTDFQTGKPKYWDDGTPMLEVVVTLDLGDEEEGRLFVRGEMLKAVRQALRDANAATLEVGGTLAVQFSQEEPSTTRGFSPKKLYTAAYKPPTAAAVKAADDLLAPPAVTADGLL